MHCATAAQSDKLWSDAGRLARKSPQQFYRAQGPTQSQPSLYVKASGGSTERPRNENKIQFVLCAAVPQRRAACTATAEALKWKGNDDFTSTRRFWYVGN